VGKEFSPGKKKKKRKSDLVAKITNLRKSRFYYPSAMKILGKNDKGGGN